VFRHLDTIQLDDTESESEPGYPRWPHFTDIVQSPGRDLSLGPQHFEVKLVVRKAMDAMLESLLFHNGFPSLATRAVWSRRSFINACAALEGSVGDHATDRYKTLSERFKKDAGYVRELAKLVRICQTVKPALTFSFQARSSPPTHSWQPEDCGSDSRSARL
jgi:hypothetical protein